MSVHRHPCGCQCPCEQPNEPQCLTHALVRLVADRTGQAHVPARELLGRLGLALALVHPGNAGVVEVE